MSYIMKNIEIIYSIMYQPAYFISAIESIVILNIVYKPAILDLFPTHWQHCLLHQILEPQTHNGSDKLQSKEN